MRLQRLDSTYDQALWMSDRYWHDCRRLRLWSFSLCQKGEMTGNQRDTSESSPYIAGDHDDHQDGGNCLLKYVQHIRSSRFLAGQVFPARL